MLPRFVALPRRDGGPPRSPALETAIRLHLGDLFPGMDIDRRPVPGHPRQRVRDRRRRRGRPARAIEEHVRKRRRGQAVRLEVEAEASPDVVEFLADALDLHPADVYPVPGMLDLTGLFQIYGLPGFPTCATRRSPGPGRRRSRRRPARGRPSAPATSSSTTLTSRSPASSTSSRPRPTTTACWPSSRRSTARQRLPDRPRPAAGRRPRQAGDGGDRAEGPAGRGAEHPLGAGAGKGRRPRRVRVRRAEDALQGGAGRPPGGRRASAGTSTWRPATTTRRRPASTPTWGSSPRNPDFADDVSALFNYLTGYAELPQWRKLIVAPSRLQNVHDREDRPGGGEPAGRPGRAGWSPR